MSKELPSTEGEWHDALEAADLSLLSIHDHPDTVSASGISNSQFMRLQVIWNEDKPNGVFRKLISDDSYASAKSALERQYWREYIASVKKYGINLPDGAFPTEVGCMSLVQYYQLQCLNAKATERFVDKVSPIKTRSMILKLKGPKETSPSRGSRSKTKQKELEKDKEKKDISPIMDDLRISDSESSTSSEQGETTEFDIGYNDFDTPANNPILYPATEDEQIVNTALLLYLTSLVMYSPIRLSWTLHRKAFFLRHSRDIKFKNVYQAQVDGYLRSKDKQNSNPKIIVEVKPFIRSDHLQKIQMQESAQMAAWISNFPDRDYGNKTTFRFVTVLYPVKMINLLMTHVQ